jgi:predicted transcriptional regulator of viral defense system
MKPTDFFDKHPLFRHGEFVEAHTKSGRRSPQTSATVLKQHVAAGNLLHIRRGLYSVVPRGVEPRKLPVDPYLVASKLADDAVVSYHAALQFHGKAYSVWHRFHYLTRGRFRSFSFQGQEFIPVRFPVTLRTLRDLGGGIQKKLHAGGEVRVTTLERTLVDVLDAPLRCGGWEEVWRSLEMVEFFDLDAVNEYVTRLRSAITAARVGFFLDQHREQLMVEDRHLRVLRSLSPPRPRYLDSRRESGKVVAGWNLVVPERVLNRAWAEVS